MIKPKYPKFSFEYRKTGLGKARLGKITTPHGVVETPNFIFCGTKATVKGVTAEQLLEAGTQFVLSNTYHLMLSPGADCIERRGGLHRFMNWNGPMLTDSGGYQIFAMGHGSVAEEVKGQRMKGTKTMLKISEEGVVFKSYIDGSIFKLTPESSIDIQRKLGADLIVQFDECTPYHVSRDYTQKSMLMSLRWGERSLREFHRSDTGKQALYGVIQGGVYIDLRRDSAAGISENPFFGTCIGGCLGQTMEQMHEIVAATMEFVPEERPIHLLGIGRIVDIIHGVEQGIDTFDCVQPTRIARHGQLILPGVKNGSINIRNAKYKEDDSPLDENGSLELSRNYSKAYLHHLFRTGEMLGPIILSRHNIAQMNCLMRDIRIALMDGKWSELKAKWLA